MKFSRLEPDKPRPGKTHKTMFYNILPSTISVKDLKKRRKTNEAAITGSSIFQNTFLKTRGFLVTGPASRAAVLIAMLQARYE